MTPLNPQRVCHKKRKRFDKGMHFIDQTLDAVRVLIFTIDLLPTSRCLILALSPSSDRPPPPRCATGWLGDETPPSRVAIQSGAEQLGFSASAVACEMWPQSDPSVKIVGGGAAGPFGHGNACRFGAASGVGMGSRRFGSLRSPTARRVRKPQSVAVARGAAASFGAFSFGGAARR